MTWASSASSSAAAALLSPGATVGRSDHLAVHASPRAGRMVIRVSLTRTRGLRWDCDKRNTSPPMPDGTAQAPNTVMWIPVPGAQAGGRKAAAPKAVSSRVAPQSATTSAHGELMWKPSAPHRQ